MRRRLRNLLGSFAFILLALVPARAGDQPQWGYGFTRNQVSDEKNLPDTFDLETGKNVRWTVRLGTETYSTPVVATGRIFVGTNNERPRDPRLGGDRGVNLCLDEKNGGFLWQLAATKRGPSPFWDWPRCGTCSPATVEGDRVYTVTNRGEVVCLDIDGMADGNDGPYQDEATLMGLRDGTGPTDADVIWLFDYTKGAGVRQHDGSHCSILIHGSFLYVNTSNGLNDEHSAMGNPEAPSLIVLDKATGRYVAREKEGVGRRTFHSTWSSPALGEAGGKTLVFFGGGDGVVYAFDPLREASEGGEPAALKVAWKHDCDPEAPKEDVHKYIRNRREGPSNIKSMPVFHEGRVYVTYGGDVWWGKNQAWLRCLDAATGQAVWTYPLKRHVMVTPAVCDGLATIGDSGGTVHAVDAATGQGVWTHDAGAEMWASTLVADGKVYAGTRNGTFWILSAGREKKVLSSVKLDSAIHGTPVAANGVLYVATMTTLHALAVPSR
jgi:outer membrane protein assembly factor BamB